MQTNQFDQTINPAVLGSPSLRGVNVGNPPVPVQAVEISDVATLRPQNAVRRDTNRFIVMAGDLMPDDVKRNFRGIEGTQLGGQWFSQTEIPGLWKFSGFVHRGRITPIIKKPVQAFADETAAKKKSTDILEIKQAGGDIKEIPNVVYRTEFPHDSMQSILGSHHGEMGFTEVAALEGIDWDSGVVQDIQNFFFPNWKEIVAGRESLPFTLREFEHLINLRASNTNESAIHAVRDAFIDSADKFRAYATATVGTSKRLAERAVNAKGFATDVSPYARFLAAQIEMEVEAPTLSKVIAANSAANYPQTAPVVQSTMSAEEIELKKQELAIRQQEIDLKRLELGLDKPVISGLNELVQNSNQFAPVGTVDLVDAQKAANKLTVERNNEIDRQILAANEPNAPVVEPNATEIVVEQPKGNKPKTR